MDVATTSLWGQVITQYAGEAVKFHADFTIVYNPMRSILHFANSFDAPGKFAECRWLVGTDSFLPRRFTSNYRHADSIAYRSQSIGTRLNAETACLWYANYFLE